MMCNRLLVTQHKTIRRMIFFLSKKEGRMHDTGSIEIQLIDHLVKCVYVCVNRSSMYVWL